jgi:hypothetical protein
MQVYLLEVSLLKELVDGSNGLKTDTISFSNYYFVFLVHSWHTYLHRALSSARSTSVERSVSDPGPPGWVRNVV